MEEKKDTKDITNDLEKNNSTQEDTDIKVSSSTEEPSISEEGSSLNTDSTEIKQQDQDQDQNQENGINEELLNKLDSTFKKTNEKLVSLEEQELSSLKMPKQSLYKKREIFLKDNIDKINSAFKYLVYINRRKNKTK